ncbi:MAG TPA: carbamoyltransferase C-terminal domain-containing protein, partial [Pyrinomonadaceae bacterium]|nr:carbamoyltransferase C-terminal domain-containing protein [Pyrinomonadaceae bacterium]
LVSTFGQLTAVPMLLNTSFNRAGEPLVETPIEAGRCVINSTADYLVVDKVVYRNVVTAGWRRARDVVGEAAI